MDLFGEFLKRLTWELTPFLNWAINNWAITMVTLLLLIRWAGHKRRKIRHV